MRPLLLSAWILLVPLASLAAVEPTSNRLSPLGINLGGVVDWSTEYPFVDVFRTSRAWISQAEGKPWGQGEELEFTEDGWVKSLKDEQYATTLVLVGGGHPVGRYLCLYDGEGRLTFQGNGKVIREQPGRIELDVSSRESLLVHLRKTDPENPVRNIRLLLPGSHETYETHPFYRPFLERNAQFRVIRFMDWMRTNDSKIVKWSDRPRVTDATQSAKGVALEHMLALANTLQCDPWFCMPHLADDDYVRHFAQQVKEELHRQAKLYIEHSNEVWNGQFTQARYAAERGKDLKLSDNAYQAQLFYHARRSVQIFAIFEEVFGGTERLVRVLGSQSANPWVSEQIMAFENAHNFADAVAIAPYFGNALGNPKTADEVAGLSLDEIFARCEQSIAENRSKIESVVAQAKKLRLRVIAYEAGQHLVGYGGAENNQTLTDKLQAANRHPRMKELYLADLANWKAAGGELCVMFSSVSKPSKWGSWGLLESETQSGETAPKYQAVQQFIRESPAWWKE